MPATATATRHDFPTTELGMLREALAEQTAEGAPAGLLDALRAAIAKRTGRPEAPTASGPEQRPSSSATTTATRPGRDYTRQIEFFEALLARKVPAEGHDAYRARVGDDPRARSRAIDALIPLADLPTEAKQDKQLDFLMALIARKIPAAQQDRYTRCIPPSRSDRSKLIDRLLDAKDVPGQGPAEIEVGMYSRDGQVYRVRRAKASQRLYAKVLDRETGSYAAAPDALRTLAAADRMTVEQVTALSRDLHQCCVCSTRLTKPESIERGIGPVCAGKV